MIGILGGTFDPIHYGHLNPAQELLDAVGFEEIRLMPSAVPPHRETPVASARQRLDMVRLATPG
jgi:nicotinate-nucleotide adenylyltransferase